MKLKKLTAMMACLVLVVSLLTIPAAALDHGVYTANMTTSYYNPDTGEVDDSGSSNAALGEGMCRSATGPTCLVEVDKDGTVWMTVRLLLASNCKNAAFYVRNGNNSYSQVSYEITGEDSGNDSIDYRFKIPSAGTKLKATMYVTPMGRDVMWYLYADTNTLTSGSGDFTVCIDTSEPEAPVAPPAPEKPAPAPAEKPAPVTPAPEKETEESAAPTEKPVEETETPMEQPEEETVPEEETAPEETAPEAETAPEEPEEEAAPEETPAEEEGGSGFGMTSILALAAVVILAGVLVLMRKKK